MQCKDFGTMLKTLRNKNHMSQDQLAKALKVSRQTIAKTEKGTNIPKAEIAEDAYMLFRSETLVDLYADIQQDQNELIYLANRIYPENYELADRLLRRVIKHCFKINSLHLVASNMFQLIMWDLKHNKKVNRRKVDTIIQVFSSLEPESFGELLELLYSESYDNGKNFDAYIKISEGIMNKLKLDKRRDSLLHFQTATAHYFKGSYLSAHTISSKGLEIADGELFEHSPRAYHRHGLICLQFNRDGYSQAIKAFSISYEMAGNDIGLKYSSLSNAARAHYMNGDFELAMAKWRTLFDLLHENDLDKIYALNDMIMIALHKNDIPEAKRLVQECERLLTLAEVQKLGPYPEESLLLERGKVLLEAVESNNYLQKDVFIILNKLKNFYQQDEYYITNNFVLERIIDCSKME